MEEKIGTLGDRIANRIVRHLPGPRVVLKTERPIVSFTMDDAPRDAWENGARILEDNGVRGTFYITGRLAKEQPQAFVSADQCRDLHLRGHEIGCHTYSHRKLSGFSKSALREDLAQNERFLQSNSPKPERRNFAFPYGMASPRHQPMLRQQYRTSRSVIGGINRGSTDPWNLAGVELRPDPVFLDRARSALEDLLHNPGWLIFFTHDISENPSFYGCPSDVFGDLIRRATAGGAEILTIDQAADHFNIAK